MTGRSTQTGSAGFTLLEVLVSLVVLAAIVAGLAGGIRFGTAAWSAQERMLAAGSDLDAVDRALRRLVAGMDPVGDGKAPPLAGLAGSMDFAADLPEAVESVQGRRAAMRLSVGAEGLVLRWAPAPHATPLVPAAPVTTDILPGVERLELSYFGDAGHGMAWQRSWSAPRLPALVRIRLVFSQSDKRRWTDIVEAPRRTTPR